MADTGIHELTLEVGHSPMRLRIGEPAVRFGAGPHPAIVLAFHREGFSSFTQEVLATFAEAGYVIVAPDLYHRSAPAGWEEGYQHRDDNDVLTDLAATLGYLRSRADVRQDQLIVAGHCQGGRVALLAASVWPEAFAACLSYYGGGLFDHWGESPTPFERLAALRCPVAGFFGQDDTYPSPAHADRLEAALREAGVPLRFHRYPHTGHAFMFRGTAKFRPVAAAAAWHHSFEFLADQGLLPFAPA